MKMYSLWSVVMIAAVFSTCTMDKPLLSDQNLLTPSKRVKLDLVRLSRDAIKGYEHSKQDEENFDPVVNASLLAASPEKFCKDLRVLRDEDLQDELRKKGILPEMIQARWSDAAEFIQEKNAVISTFTLESPLKKECVAIARKMGIPIPEFRGARLDNPAECRGPLILIDPEYLYEEAPTREARAVIVGHECAHSASHDYQRDIATHMACDVAGVHLSPRFAGRRSRCDEFFADLRMATRDRSFAQSNRDHCRKNRHIYGDGIASSHHSYKDRDREAELVHALHETHEAKKQKTLKRDLNKEFEDAAWGK